jgi:hypothetical protein
MEGMLFELCLNFSLQGLDKFQKILPSIRPPARVSHHMLRPAFRDSIPYRIDDRLNILRNRLKPHCRRSSCLHFTVSGHINMTLSGECEGFNLCLARGEVDYVRPLVRAGICYHVLAAQLILPV